MIGPKNLIVIRNSKNKPEKSSNSKNAEILSTDLKLKLPVIFCRLRLNIVDSPERLIARTAPRHPNTK